MSYFVQSSDFSDGGLRIPTTQYSVKVLQAFIDTEEPRILKQLLGCALYEDFITNWVGDPTEDFADARFKVIYDPFCIDDDCGILESEGIKKMLMYFIYYKYTAETPTTPRINGFAKESNDNSESSSAMGAATFTKYNAGVDSYASIQRYMDELNPENYDYIEFNGQPKKYLTWF